MAKYFTLEELIKSDIARREKIRNEPSPPATINLMRLMEILDKIRECWSAPITVNSGFRCTELNRLVKGAPNSQHITGEAADITAGTKGANNALFDLIRKLHVDGLITFDQLIDEKKYSWIHISVKATNNRNQILHL